MAININWGTRVINIPKLDTTLVQSTPTEIRSLDINTFRLALKDLEVSDNGMNFPITHNHNTTVSLSGVTYARIVELINGYTVTFEDGQYAVNLVGANSNIADKVNVNQVSVRSSNAAGLIEVSTSGTGGPTASEIAGAVWDEPAMSHTATGSLGLLVNQISVDVNDVLISQATLQTLLNTLLKYERNRTKIDVIANTMTIFDNDGTTPLTVFNLKDKNGNMSVAEVAERVPQ